MLKVSLTTVVTQCNPRVKNLAGALGSLKARTKGAIGDNHKPVKQREAREGEKE